MREIKYRAKVNEKGLDNFWEYGGIIHITEKYKDEEDFEECDIWQLINTDGVSFNVDETTIGEYTGLKDKNGKEIFEGDIISSGTEKCVVVWIGQYAGFMLKLIRNDIEAEWTNPIIDMKLDDEVIGNIYDNPELLKEE